MMKGRNTDDIGIIQTSQLSVWAKYRLDQNINDNQLIVLKLYMRTYKKNYKYIIFVK